MIRFLILRSLNLLSVTFSVAFAVVGSSMEIQAQTLSTIPLPLQAIHDANTFRVTFEPPREGKPDDTAEGASRSIGCAGGCMIPLVPAISPRLTATPYPTFFVYIPQSTTETVFFALLDENEVTHYQTKIPIANRSGILSVKLPDTLPPLEVDKTYQWAFVMIGEQGLRPGDPSVRGEVRRVQLADGLMSQIESKTWVERAALYGKHGIWYDTLASLAQARQQQPSNSTLIATWQDLLNSVGLEAIATQPLLP